MLERTPIIGPGSIKVADDEIWSGRNEYWANLSRSPRFRAKRTRVREPLVLCGHSVCLRVERGTLLIRNGRTHHPQEREEYRFFRGDPNLPPRIIVLDGSGSMSFDVLSWLSEQNLPLIRIDWRGEAVCIIGGAGSAYLPEKIAWQIETRNDPEKRLAFGCDLISKKLEESLKTLQLAIPASHRRDNALAIAEGTISRLARRDVRDITALFLAEARAAAAYFIAWRGVELHWRQKTKFPVPNNWLIADGRRSMRGRFATNRNATHPINAMLNYAYGVLHSHIQIGTLAVGYDPSRGVLHESRSDCHALILDLVEPHRPEVDRAVLEFVGENHLSAGDFHIQQDGCCRLAPQLARRFCELVVVETGTFVPRSWSA